MEFQRHFLGWDKPFTLSFTEQLKEDSGSRGQLDECLIWVPSSRAGRHILSELFTGEAEATEAFHPPRFTTPAQYERSLPEIQPCASIPQQLLAWKSILQEISPEKLVDLFPAVPLRGKNQWAFSVADQLIRIRQHLQDNGHDFTTVARSAPDHDKARWLILADLEGQYLGNLQAEGLTDPGTGFVERIKAALAVAPFKRLLVAGVLNLSHRQVSCIKVLSEYGIRIEFYLPIPQEFSESLDEWCRPRVGNWDQEAIPGELLQGSIQRSSEPRELVDRVLDLADVYEAGDEALVIGSPESETAKYIVERSRLTGTPLYMPQGKALKDTAWGRLCRLLSKLGREGSTRHLMELLRHSLFRKWAQSSGCDLEAAEAALLNLHREHLILDLEQLADPALRPIEAIGTIKPVLNLIKPLLAGPAKGDSFPEWLWSVLQEIRQGIKLSSESRDVLGQLEECLQDLRSDFDPSLVNTGDYWEILTFLLENSQYYPEREAEERPVSGWLELPWERAPHLVIVGLPDNQVPGRIGTEAFLPATLCRQLGLSGPDEAAAFHACRLRIILESRRNWGKLDILLPDRGMDDEPEQACRFLFLAKEEEILERVQLLLGERPAQENAIPATFGGQLDLPEPAPLERISVTDFSAYLYSPLHYLMERSFRWSPPRELPVEMDALSFGQLAHAVLERLNGSKEGAILITRADIEAYVEDQLSVLIKENFGSRRSVPVVIQESGLRERLRTASEIISNQRMAGWKPVKTEWRFLNEIDLLIEGVRVSGVIDLVERNDESGLYRVIDYKTSDTAADALKAHLMKPNARSPDPWFPESDFIEEEKTWRWKDLQLILYYHAVSLSLDAPAEVGYLSLAKAVKEIRLSTWSPSERQVTAALECAGAVVRQIRSGVFPAGKASRYKDEWLPWFGGDYTTGIHPDWLERHLEAEA